MHPTSSSHHAICRICRTLFLLLALLALPYGTMAQSKKTTAKKTTTKVTTTNKGKKTSTQKSTKKTTTASSKNNKKKATTPKVNPSQKVKKMQRESSNLKKEINKSENLIVDNKNSVAVQMSNLTLLNSQIDEQQTVIKQIGHETDSINGAIGVMEKDLVRLRKELDMCKSNYRRALTYVSYTRLQQSRWTYILMAKDFRTMYRRIRYASEYSKNQKARGELIKKKEEEIRVKQEQLKGARATKEELMGKAKRTQEDLVVKKGEREAIVKELDKQREVLEENLVQQRKKYADLNAQIDKLIQQEIAAAEARRKAEAEKRRQRAAQEAARKKAEEEKRKAEEAKKKEAQKAAQTKKEKRAAKKQEKAAKKAEKKGNVQAAPAKPAPKPEPMPKINDYEDVDTKLSNNFAANRGKLPSPVAGGASVTGKFGKYQVEGLSGVTLENKGCNLTARSGARAQSIFEGEVTKVVNIGGTYTVIIRHGNYYSVYSNLSTVYVTAGTKVSIRQQLGTLAVDGAGNAMLHFQLRRNTEKLNPLSWIRP
jgi:septal ring factor EnvC (AmiA/AmiB activator)